MKATTKHVHTSRNNFESDLESDDDVSPMNVSINIKCSFDPNSPSGVKCKVVHDPEDISDAIKRARDDESKDDSDEDEIEVQTVKKNLSKLLPKKNVDDKSDDEEEEEDEDDDESDYDEHPELDDTEDLDGDSDEDDDPDATVMSCVQRALIKKRR